jgi:chromosome segregation ATPase
MMSQFEIEKQFKFINGDIAKFKQEMKIHDDVIYELEQMKNQKTARQEHKMRLWQEYKREMHAMCRVTEQTALKAYSEIGAQRKINLRLCDDQEKAERILNQLQASVAKLTADLEAVRRERESWVVENQSPRSKKSKISKRNKEASLSLERPESQNSKPSGEAKLDKRPLSTDVELPSVRRAVYEQPRLT